MPASLSHLQDDLNLGLSTIKDLWPFNTRNWVMSVHAADIDQDGDIEVVAGTRDGRVYLLTKSGRRIWERTIHNKPWLTSVGGLAAPVNQQPARIITATRDGEVFALNKDGDLLPPPDASNGVFASSDKNYWYNASLPISQLHSPPELPSYVVFCSEDRFAYALDAATGLLLWKFPTNGRVRAVFSYDINGDGELETLIGSQDQYLYVLDIAGNLLAKRFLGYPIFALYATDIDRDGQVEILVGTRAKNLLALTPDLQEKWSRPVSSRVLALAVVDANNDGRLEILVASDDKYLSILNDEGKVIWHYNYGFRLFSLYAVDLDRDGHMEVLAGSEANCIVCFRVQLSKDVDKKILRSYNALGKPDPKTLSSLTDKQRDLLLDVLGISNRPFDPTLHIKHAEALMEQGDYTNALVSLRQLQDQKVQLLWQKERIGYLNTLCFSESSSDARSDVVVGTQDGTVYAFNANGRLLSSVTFPGEQIDDIQSVYFSGSRHMDILSQSSSGKLALLRAGRRREISTNVYEDPVACFFILSSSPEEITEIFIGTAQGQVLLYTNNFQQQVLKLDAPAVQLIFAPEPQEGIYRSPEILVASSRQISAYTRGGKYLWSFRAFGHILALNAKDLDGDGDLEILVGSEDRNIYVLDHNGNLLWRYFLPHSVMTLEAADLDGDGSMEVLAGCTDGVLSVFTATGDLVWRYYASDRIQRIRVADIDQDGHQEIAIILEDRLEVLQVVSQSTLTNLVAECWSHILPTRSSFDELVKLSQEIDLESPVVVQDTLAGLAEELIKLSQDVNPYLRAAALDKLAELSRLQVLPAQAFDLFQAAATLDTLIDVRKVLPRSLIMAYSSDPTRTRTLLNQLFTDPVRDVRIEVIENLQRLVEHDWDTIFTYLKRASESTDRTTRRAAIRKISHLIAQSEDTQADQLFSLLLSSLLDAQSIWIKQESGTVLARLLEKYPDNLLMYFYKFLASPDPMDDWLLRHIASNLVSSQQQLFSVLLSLYLDTNESNVLNLFASAVEALINARDLKFGTDTWLLCGEVLALLNLASLEDLALYESRLVPEHFHPENTAVLPFLHLIEHFKTISRALKVYLHRGDYNDRLNSLLDGMNALENLQRQSESKYGFSPVPGAPRPRFLEFSALQILFVRWKELLREQLIELRGRPELSCELQSRQVHYEETVGIWLAIANKGRNTAHSVEIKLLSNEGCEVLKEATFKTEAIFAQQHIVVEFLIRPLKAPLDLEFEVVYDDADEGLKSFAFHERLDFIEGQREFISIDNPYSTGTPALGRMCYGREKELAYLHDNLTRTSAQTVLVLYGQRRSGKTTLLFQLAQSALLADHVPVLIDMQRLSYSPNLSGFLFKIAYAIAQAMNKKNISIVLPVRAEFDLDATFAFDCFLDGVEPCLNGRKLILMLDEFEVLEEQVRNKKLQPEIFQYLRSQMQHRQYMHFLLSGTHHIEQLTRNYWSVFFNIALHYRLPGKIDASGSESLITQPVAGFLEYEPLALTKVRQLTADQPYLIHLVCRSLVDHCNQQRKNFVSINDVNLVQREVMETGSVHFDWIWDQIVPNERILLAAIAEGCREEGRVLSLEDIGEIYRKYHIPYHYQDVVAALKVLWAADVIETDNGARLENILDEARYHVSIGLLWQWLRRERPLNSVQKV